MRDVGLLVRKDLWEFRNQLRDMTRHPGRLVGYLLVLLFLGGTIALNTLGPAARKVRTVPAATADTGMLVSMLFFILLSLLMLYSGSKYLSAQFSMADTNLVFTAPFSEKKIMMWITLKQTVMTLLSSVFILFVGPTIANFMPQTHASAYISVLAYLLLMILLAPVTLMLSLLRNHFGTARSAVIFWCVLCLLPLIYPVVQLAGGHSFQETARLFVQWPYTEWMPVLGWIFGLFCIPAHGFGLHQGILLLLCILAWVIFNGINLYLSHDYYELAEVTARMRADARAASRSRRGLKIEFKVGKVRTSEKIRGFTGAGAFFWRAKVEASRAGLNPYLTLRTLLMAAGSLAVSIILRRFPLEGDDITGFFVAANALAAYFLFLLNGFIPMDRELTRPHIFYFPGSTFRKIMAACAMPVLAILLDAFLFNLPFAIILSVSPLATLGATLALSSCILLSFMASMLLRLVLSSRFDQAVLYAYIRTFSMMFLLALGLVGGIITGVMTQMVTPALFICTAGNLVVAFSLAALCMLAFERYEFGGD